MRERVVDLNFQPAQSQISQPPISARTITSSVETSTQARAIVQFQTLINILHNLNGRDFSFEDYKKEILEISKKLDFSFLLKIYLACELIKRSELKQQLIDILIPPPPYNDIITIQFATNAFKFIRSILDLFANDTLLQKSFAERYHSLVSFFRSNSSIALMLVDILEIDPYYPASEELYSHKLQHAPSIAPQSQEYIFWRLLNCRRYQSLSKNPYYDYLVFNHRYMSEDKSLEANLKTYLYLYVITSIGNLLNGNNDDNEVGYNIAELISIVFTHGFRNKFVACIQNKLSNRPQMLIAVLFFIKQHPLFNSYDTNFIEDVKVSADKITVEPWLQQFLAHSKNDSNSVEYQKVVMHMIKKIQLYNSIIRHPVYNLLKDKIIVTLDDKSKVVKKQTHADGRLAPGIQDYIQNKMAQIVNIIHEANLTSTIELDARLTIELKKYFTDNLRAEMNAPNFVNTKYDILSIKHLLLPLIFSFELACEKLQKASIASRASSSRHTLLGSANRVNEEAAPNTADTNEAVSIQGNTFTKK